MAYIVREKDGEHFVIPSYRDVLNVQQKNQLKQDILNLSQSYGEYITLQKKSPTQYEVAFSPDTGYLLGESIWQYFKSPPDMIYCEALPNSNQAILVIVKGGSVYLDGSFPTDGIPEELVIFLTQENHFEIYIYGDVPISEHAATGKFNFDSSSVRSFHVLEKPIFESLPLIKAYQLQLVDPVLKANGIGVLPFRNVIVGIVVLGLLWMGWSYFSTPKQEVVETPQVNPYQQYNAMLSTADPYAEIQAFLNHVQVMFALPAWQVTSINYAKGNIVAAARADGGKIQLLLDYCNNNGINVVLNANKVTLTMPIQLARRPVPNKIYPIQQLLTHVLDQLTPYINGSTIKMQIGKFAKKDVYTDVEVKLNFTEISPDVLMAVATQLKDLPIALQGITMNVANGSFSGSLTFDVLGN